MRSPGTQSRTEPLPDNAPHILVVDDDQKIRELLGRFLVSSGYRVTEAADAASARSFMRGLAFDLVMLDVMMPGESGLSLARDLKATRPVPILMLTALADAEDRISGLEAGVDDYVTKPFEPRELLLRLRNILRRGQVPNTQSDEIRMGPCVFSVTRGELRRDEESMKLTERERDLMRLFAMRIGVPVPREPFSFGGWNDSRFGANDITGKSSIEFWTKLKKTTTKWNPEAEIGRASCRERV